MILDPEAFEFITDRGVRLPLDGELLMGGSDSVEHRITEHLLLNQAGAIHQAQGQGPRKYSFRCIKKGASAKQDYRNIEEAQADQPFGTLIHPWFGSVPAVFRTLALSYDFDTSTNSLEFEAGFVQTTIRKVAPGTPSGSAAAAQQVAAALVASPRVASTPALATRAATVLSSVDSLQALLVADTSLTLQPLRVALSRVSQAVDAVLTLAGGSDKLNGWVTYQARLTFCRALEAYNLAAASRPPVIVHPVAGVISLPRLCVQLYGGGATSMEAEIMALNRVRPLAIQTGTRLLIPDPEWVKRTLQ